MTTAISECASFPNNPVEKADAASRLAIDHINGIGTEHPGTTFPLLPDTANSALFNRDTRLVANQSGLFQESRLPGHSQFQQVGIEDIFLHYYQRRETEYVCRERMQQGQEHCFSGNLVRTVLEDKVVMFPEGSRIPVVGLGSLSPLPLFQDGDLVELCGYDELYNIFALKAFRLGAQPVVYLPFRPMHSGIGRLETDMERTPNVLFDEALPCILNRPPPYDKLTFIYLGSDWESIRWPAPCGLSYGMVFHLADTERTDRRRRERLLRIIASAASQGIRLGVMMEGATPKANGEPIVSRSWMSQEAFIKDCKDRGMPIPNILEPSCLLVETGHSRIPGLPLFGSNGPVTAIAVQKGLEPRVALARIVKAFQKKTFFGPQIHFLLVVPDDYVWEAKRAVESSGLSLEMTTIQRIATPELFNQAMHKAQANALLMYGFKQNENCKDITRILGWCDKRGVPVGCISFGESNELNAGDYYLYDNVFEAKMKKNGEVEFLIKHPASNHDDRICLDADGMEIAAAKSILGMFRPGWEDIW
ncbi:MAG: hypothetical protein IJS08_17105 [Victivallales bacterium]|nr:hypothetical protein [Victivallales bacterium]